MLIIDMMRLCQHSPRSERQRGKAAFFADRRENPERAFPPVGFCVNNSSLAPKKPCFPGARIL